MGLNQKAAANGFGIPESRLSELINGKLRLGVEYALRLSLFFGMDEQKAEFICNVLRVT